MIILVHVSVDGKFNKKSGVAKSLRRKPEIGCTVEEEITFLYNLSHILGWILYIYVLLYNYYSYIIIHNNYSYYEYISNYQSN